MKRPCICDLKMGPQTFDSDASLIKRVQMGAFDKMSTSSNLGFRMCGMRVRTFTCSPLTSNKEQFVVSGDVDARYSLLGVE
jgi:hypothetical protein